MAPAMDEASAFAVLRERFPEKSDDEIRAALAQAAAAKEAKAAKKDGEKKKSKKDGEKKKAAASEPQTSPTKEAPAAAKSPPAVDVSDAPAPAPPPAPPPAAQPPAASSSSKKPADAPDAPAAAKPTNEQDLEWKQAQNALNEANRLCNSIKKEIGGYMKRKDTVPPDLFTQKASHEAEVKRLNELIKELDMNRKDGKEQQAKPAATTPPPPPPPTTPAAAAPATAAPSSSATATVPPLGPPPTIHKPGSSGSGLRTLNINVGVLGHVDSGKTSLTKALSTVGSTAAFDKHPQSKERGITLDLGFSSFIMDLPAHLRDTPYDRMQVTLVDCPGHASLIRTIIGGAQIIGKHSTGTQHTTSTYHTPLTPSPSIPTLPTPPHTHI